MIYIYKTSLKTSSPLLKTSRPLLPPRCFAPTERYAFLCGRQGCGFNPGTRNAIRMWDICGLECGLEYGLEYGIYVPHSSPHISHIYPTYIPHISHIYPIF